MGALCEVVPTGARSCLRLKQSSLVRPSPLATFVVKGPFLVRFCFLGFAPRCETRNVEGIFREVCKNLFVAAKLDTTDIVFMSDFIFAPAL